MKRVARLLTIAGALSYAAFASQWIQFFIGADKSVSYYDAKTLTCRSTGNDTYCSVWIKIVEASGDYAQDHLDLHKETRQ
jgi:hypothetical protein